MNIEIKDVENVTGTAIDKRDDGTWVWSNKFDLTELINTILEFIRNLIKFEF